MNADPQILIVEDQLEICQLLARIFKKLDIQTVFAGSIKETNEVLSTSRPSVIMIDQILPDGKGFDHIADIRKMLPQTRIIAMTSYNVSQSKKQAIGAGANSFLEKPFSTYQVYQAVFGFYNN